MCVRLRAGRATNSQQSSAANEILCSRCGRRRLLLLVVVGLLPHQLTAAPTNRIHLAQAQRGTVLCSRDKVRLSPWRLSFAASTNVIPKSCVAASFLVFHRRHSLQVREADERERHNRTVFRKFCVEDE